MWKGLPSMKNRIMLPKDATDNFMISNTEANTISGAFRRVIKNLAGDLKLDQCTEAMDLADGHHGLFAPYHIYHHTYFILNSRGNRIYASLTMRGKATVQLKLSFALATKRKPDQIYNYSVSISREPVGYTRIPFNAPFDKDKEVYQIPDMFTHSDACGKLFTFTLQ